MQGDFDQCVYLLESGLLKAYYTTEQGKEAVKSFIQPGEVIGSLSAAFSGEGCSFSLVCLETGFLIKIPFQVIDEYGQKDHEIARAMVSLLLRLAMKKEKREYEFLCLSAEERYRLMKQTSPNLLNKVTQNDTARYLGITPVAMSRIKSRVREQTD